MAYTNYIMITQELIVFIRQQLAAGMTRDQISQVLVANGWHQADVDEGFVYIQPPQVTQPPVQQMTQPVAQPAVTYQPTVQQASPIMQQPVQPVLQQPIQPIVQQPIQPTTSGASQDWFRNPNSLLGFGMAVLTSIIGAVFIYVLNTSLPHPVPGNSASILGGLLILVAILIESLILRVTTRVVKIEGATFQKAITFVSLQVIISLILGVIIKLAHQASGITAGVELVIWLGMFYWYYQVTFFKSAIAFILNWLFTAILGGILVAAVFFIGLGSLMHLISSPQTMPATINQPSMVSQTATLVTPTVASGTTASDAASLSIANNPNGVTPITLAEAASAFPLGFTVPTSDQITHLDVATIGSNSMVTINYTQKDTVSNIKAQYTTLLKQDGYSLGNSIKVQGAEVVIGTKKLSDGRTINKNFIIRSIGTTSEVDATLF